jgi:hypothetical protein
MNNPEAGAYFQELRNPFFRLKYFNSLMRIRDGKNSDPGCYPATLRYISRKFLNKYCLCRLCADCEDALSTHLAAQDAHLTPGLLAHRLETSRRGQAGSGRANPGRPDRLGRLPLVTSLLLLLILAAAALPTAYHEMAGSWWKMIGTMMPTVCQVGFWQCFSHLPYFVYFLT